MRKLRYITYSTIALAPTALLAETPQCTAAGAIGADCNGGGLTTQISNILDTTFTVIGVLAVLILLVGAVRYITSTGDAKRITQAKDTIIYAILGLVVAILARAIVGFVIAKVA